MRRFLFAVFALTLAALLPGCDQWSGGTNQPNTSTAPSSVADKSGDIGEIVKRAHYDKILSNRVEFYSYDGFIGGGSATEGFCTIGKDIPTRIRECAAFLANAAHETGGGKYITEIARNKCPDYCDTSQRGACAPAPGQSYYGRGWLQVSWNYNYCAASKFIYGDDGSALVKNPDILEKDAGKATQASLWYWMTQSGPGTMPAHDCMTKNVGFGCTIWSINGSLECNGKNTAQVRSRVTNYANILAILGDSKVVPVGRNDC